jgi:O-antigen/teichoic acid export membrane protein
MVHLAATLLALVTSIVIARILGAEGYGVFAFALALAYLLGIPAVVGLNQLLVREVAQLADGQEHGAAAGILRRADHVAIAGSVLLALGAVGVTWALDPDGDGQMTTAVYIVSAAIPLLSLVRVRQAALQGLGKIVQGQTPETVALPGLFLLLVLGYALIDDRPLTAEVTLVLQVVALLATLLLATGLLRRHLPPEIRNAHPQYRTREWLSSALPLMFVTGLYVINSRTDTMMLAAMEGPEAVGIYNVASRGAGFVGFFLLAGQRALAPTLARFHQRGDHERMQEVVTVASRLILTASVPVALALIFGGRWILDLVYGAEFVPGAGALALLSVAYLGGVAMGPVAPLLVMTGHERTAAWGVGSSAILNIILNAILIPILGLEGAAIATGISHAAWNGLFVVSVRKNLGIRPSAFARRRRPV